MPLSFLGCKLNISEWAYNWYEGKGGLLSEGFLRITFGDVYWGEGNIFGGRAHHRNFTVQYGGIKGTATSFAVRFSYPLYRWHSLGAIFLTKERVHGEQQRQFPVIFPETTTVQRSQETDEDLPRPQTSLLIV